MSEKKNFSMKAVALLLTGGMLLGGTVGGTIAWLSVKTPEVTNTFTAGNISIELNETDMENNAKSFKMIPGTDISKDPTIKFTDDSEPCWLFVKVTETVGTDGTANTIVRLEENVTATEDTYLTYTMNTGWTALEGYEGVFYQKLESGAAENATYPILLNNQVSVPDKVTKTMMDEVDKGTVTPKLSFTAYAIQMEKFTSAAAAWTEVSQLQ